MQVLAVNIQILLGWLKIKQATFKDMINSQILIQSRAIIFIQQYLIKIKEQIQSSNKLAKLNQQFSQFVKFIITQDTKALFIWQKSLQQFKTNAINKNSHQSIKQDKQLLNQIQKDINYYQKLKNYTQKIADQAKYQNTTITTNISNKKYEQSPKNDSTHSSKRYYNYYFQNQPNTQKSYNYHLPITQNKLKNYQYQPGFMSDRIKRGLRQQMEKDLSQKYKNKYSYGYSNREQFRGSDTTQNRQKQKLYHLQNKYDYYQHHPFEKKKRTYKYLQNDQAGPVNSHSEKPFARNIFERKEQYPLLAKTSRSKDKSHSTSKKRQISRNKNQKLINLKQYEKIETNKPKQNIFQNKNYNSYQNYLQNINLPEDSLDQQRYQLKYEQSKRKNMQTPSTKEKTLYQLLTQSMDSLKFQQRVHLDLPDFLQPKQFIEYEDSLQMQNMQNTGYFKINDEKFGLISSILSRKQKNQSLQSNQQSSLIRELQFSFSEKI